MRPIAALFLCLSFILFACEEPKKQQHTVFVFGTLLEITLYDVDEDVADDAFTRLERQFNLQHSQWTPWQQSDLSNINAAIQDNKAFTVPDSISPLLELSRRFHQQSDGLFDPAIGKLIKLWQFHRHDDPDIRPPDEEAIRSLVDSRPSIADISVSTDEGISHNHEVDLNFGAIAKGYAIEVAIDTLHDSGIHDAIINAGGDLTVSGMHGDRDWSIGIRHPREDEMIASIAARPGESVFTSGDYERYYIYEGERYHHILDPRTGYPADGAVSVTVITDDASKADAAATALFVAGSKRWREIAQRMGVRYVMLIDPAGQIHMTPAMAERIRILSQPTPRIILSEPL